ncbi:hypothetical protein [Yeosuana sp.]|uniref:hypothetical protein n=1 Tax=Yeosuana sp. TaxID=2529388 RepID=UPI00405517E3
MKNIYLVLSIIILFLSNGCKNKSANIKTEETIYGTYSFKDNSVELEITIIGNTWNGKIIIVTGFGSDYDNQNAQYNNGTINDNDLYDSSGMLKIGYVNGNSLHTSVGGQSVTLKK